MKITSFQGILLVSFAFLFGCSKSDSEVKPVRPPNVPDSAQYQFGVDGSYWLDCQIISESRIACTLYNVTGRKRFRSTYVSCITGKIGVDGLAGAAGTGRIGLKQCNIDLIGAGEVEIYDESGIPDVGRSADEQKAVKDKFNSSCESEIPLFLTNSN